jgi:molybdopterin synthase catalytic subunit
MSIRVQQADFDVGAELASLRKRHVEAGALVSFVGQVRDINEDCAVNGLTLEHYPGMTEKSLSSIARQASERWSVADSLIIHRFGALRPGDQIVLVAVLSTHRGDAFKACEFIMDYLKTEAPFWKKEVTAEGERWLEPRLSDEDARHRWKT